MNIDSTTAILLVGSAFVDRWFDGVAWTPKRYKLRVDSDAIVERIISAAIPQRFEIDHADHVVASEWLRSMPTDAISRV